MMMLSAEPPARLLTMNCVLSGAISVTTRSPRNVWVMLSDSESEPTVPLPVTTLFEVMPVALLSGIDRGTLVELNVPLMQPAPLTTVTCALAVWVADVPVPVTVNVAVAEGAVEAAVKVRVELPPAVTLAGLKLPVTPDGSPVTVRLTVCAAPAVTAVVTVYEMLEPALTDCDAGLTEMLKSLAGVPPQLGNLNEPMRVRQLNDPLAPMYSCVYQNVQSSLGSMFIEL